MKNFILVFLFFAMCFQAQSQEKYSTYKSGYLDKTYDIEIDAEDTSSYSIYISAFSVDELHDVGGIILRSYQHALFLSALKDARAKYAEWVETAKANNVTEVSKMMEIEDWKREASGFFMYGDKWHFQFDLLLEFQFKVINSPDGVHYLLIVRTGELESSSNEYIKVDGVALVFESAKEIDDFLENISLLNVITFKDKPKTEDLFKD